MSSSPIFFEFEQVRDALLAMDTLEELSYSPNFLADAGKPTLHIHVDDQDLTSALEITQAHGGKLIEKAESRAEPAAFAMAYDLEGSIRIPAHVVNEDWPEEYASMPDHGAGDAILSEEDFDPSTDDYDHFSSGVRL
jgi:elongation factor P--beta-lysine ligase